ncbi:hypothetical protein D3C78_1613940 [compost metagenome]
MIRISRIGDRIRPAIPKADVDRMTKDSIRKADDTPIEFPVIFGSSSCLTINTITRSTIKPIANEVLPTMNR